MVFHVITLFPHAFDSYLGESILKRAIEDKKIKVKFYNPRDYSKDKWARVDRPPYGGGPGMVLEAGSLAKAIEAAQRSARTGKVKIVMLSPGGKQLDTSIAKKYATDFKHIILVCGRYEGIDARIKKIFKAEELSIGPYVLTGGELPAMAVIDCVSRQIEGVLGNFDSREEERVSSPEVYTRPEVFVWKGKRYRVPKILLSGNHAKIDEWKRRKKQGN